MTEQDDNPDRRFGGVERLYGVDAAAAIRAAHVGVVGIGGVGSWVAEALARSGVGRLSLIDLDHVAESNINRQVHASTQTVGQAKVTAMAERIAGIHPGCEVRTIDEFVDADTWPALQAELAGLDVLIDACDSLAAKRLMARWAVAGAKKSPRTPRLLVCGAAGGKRQAQLTEVGDLAQVTHDPLLAKLRYQLRKDGLPRTGRMGVACVFSREPVAPPHASCAIDGGASSDGSLNCHGFGSSVAVTATFGMVAVSWALEQLAKT